MHLLLRSVVARQLGTLNLLEDVGWDSVLLLVVRLLDVLLQVDVHSDDLLDLGESDPAHLLQRVEEDHGQEDGEEQKGACADQLDAELIWITSEDDALLVVKEAKSDH